MDIKLPVPIIDAKTMLSFLTLHELHHKQALHQWIAFSSQVKFIVQQRA